MTTRIHEIYIRASAQAIWEAITAPEWSAQYGYRVPNHYELKPNGKYRAVATKEMRGMGLPEVVIDGVVVEAVPPKKLVHTFRFLFSPENEKEGFTRMTWEIEPTQAGFCRLTVTHDVTNAPLMAEATISKFNGQGGGGWNWILSDLKSLLETGRPLAG